MRTVAVLGGTGKTGRAVVERLRPRQDIFVHIYVRSRARLLSLFPTIADDKRTAIFVGPLSDTDNMTACLRGAQTIVFTIGENENLPGVRVIQDAAASVLAALTHLKSSTSPAQAPRLLMLSSSTWNPTFAAARPALLDWLIKTAFHHPYQDLRAAQALLLGAPALMHVLLVQPGALIEDTPNGCEISAERVGTSVTYGDLATGFVELMDDRRGLSAVGVSSTNGDDLRYLPILLYRIAKGLCAQFIPGFWTVHGVVVWAVWGK